MNDNLPLLTMIDDQNYPKTDNILQREAVRAIILFENRIALVKSQKEGFYKFPGGGIKQGESHSDALMRETREEVGLNIIPATIKPFGMMIERRKSTLCENEIFEQKSYYYLAKTDLKIEVQNLDDYEKDLDYQLTLIDLDTAYKTNLALQNNEIYPFIKRETFVLDTIQKYLKNDMIFYDTNFLKNDEIYLKLVKATDAVLEKAWLPAYKFQIYLIDGTPIGTTDLRIGHNAKTYIGGNIGYEINEAYRGHHYAAKACRLLFKLAKLHQLDYLYITCVPDNVPSYKTCEYLGGQLIEIADIPEDNEMYQEGKRQVRVYKFEL